MMYLDVNSRLAYCLAVPELIERFPQQISGLMLAKQYLLALLPLKEKDLESPTTMSFHCPERAQATESERHMMS